jgi:hypothetical protein
LRLKRNRANSDGFASSGNLNGSRIADNFFCPRAVVWPADAPYLRRRPGRRETLREGPSKRETLASKTKARRALQFSLELLSAPLKMAQVRLPSYGALPSFALIHRTRVRAEPIR